jgi:hypothetical protein
VLQLLPLPEGIGIYTTFMINKNNVLQQRKAPSPAGEGWGEENKISQLYPPHPNLVPQGRRGFTCVDTYALRERE